MVTAVSSEVVIPKVRWSWLWDRRSDLSWNFLPFWLCLPVALVMLAARNLGDAAENPTWNFTVGGRHVHLLGIVMFFYGPLVDAPHLWATIARTYTDAEEWAARRRLFIASLLWFVIGPVVIVLPYALRAVGLLPPGSETVGWIAWSNFFTFYALFHINKQHWGFISLYKRKNGDLADARENRADQRFFYAAIWLPYVAMLTAPWYVDFDGEPFRLLSLPFLGMTTGAVLHVACHVAFFLVCAAYATFQLDQWRKGLPRNGPKLAYVASVIPLYYLAFSIHPLVASFWVLLTGVGHCAQYHRVVWAYGTSKYAGKTGAERKLPASIFENVWLYIVLGITFGLVTLQGPGVTTAKQLAASALDVGLFSRVFRFLDKPAALDLGVKMAAAFIGGVRLHHFYVDSKIWRVSKSAALAKNLNVQG
jgi:hypothetical protein